MYPDIQFDNFCRFLGGILIVFGLWKMIRYMHNAEYRNITNYDLSAGLVMMSVGVCVISTAPRLGESGPAFLGFLVLLDAVIMIQYALQIRFLDGKLFPLAIVLALLNYAFGMISIVDPRQLFHIYDRLFSILLVVSGICGLISLCLAWVRIRNKIKEEERDVRRILEEDPTEGQAVEEPILEESLGQTSPVGDLYERSLPEDSFPGDNEIGMEASDGSEPVGYLPEADPSEPVADTGSQEAQYPAEDGEAGEDGEIPS